MQAVCLQQNLSKGLAIVGRAVATRPTLPVLSHVLLTAEGSQIGLAATDLEVSVTCRIGAKVEEEGKITVPARLLTDLTGALPPERIDLGLQDHTLHVACDRNEADIKGIDAQEFPLIPAVSKIDDTGEDQAVSSETPEWEFDPILLRQMISRVVIAASTDESRPILTGVYARFEDDTLTLAAADGFRLSVCTTRLPTPVSEPIGVVIPAKALRELLRVSKDEKQPIGMSVNPSRSQVLFHLHGNAGAIEGVSDIDLASQLIEGNFPKYRQIIPQSHTTRTILNTEAFLKACKTADIFARNEAHVVYLAIKPDNEQGSGRVVVTANSVEMGNGEIELDATVEGEPTDVAFNVRFLIEALSVIDAERVALETSASATAVALRPLGSDDFTHVIMPMSPK